MRSHFHGGHDVAGSAARALPFDRLAVGVIAATVSPEWARNEPEAAADVAGDYLREPMAAASGQIVWEGDAPRETGRVSGVASCLDAQFQAKASEDNGATVPQDEMRKAADCMAGEVSRVDAGRTASATSEITDVTAGETAPNFYSPAVSCVPANLPEAAQPQAPAPAASGISFPVMSAEMARAEAVKCGRHARICMDAGAYEEARHQLEEAKRYALLAVELGASA